MTTIEFQFIAMDKAGAQRRGVTTGASQEEVYRKLASSGLTPTRIKQKSRRQRRRRRGGRISSKDISHFTYQFSALLSARIPVSDGLRSIAEQDQNMRFRAVLLDAATSIQAGSTITEAMGAHREIFGDVYIETLRAAEQSGNMIRVLEYLAEMLERDIEGSRQIKQALMYPVLVLIALGTAITFLLAFVVPKFADMFQQRGVDLPMLTQALQTFGVSLRHLWWLYALCAVGSVLLIRAGWRHPQIRRVMDRWLHKTPYLKNVLIGKAVGRFARVFGISLESGLGLMESLSMSGKATGRPMLIQDTQTMIASVRQGGKLSEALQECAYMPSFAKRMIAAGEESAELTRMCGVVAKYYEREVSYLMKNASTVIEPVLIALLTGVVLIVALSIFLPMWDMASLIQ